MFGLFGCGFGSGLGGGWQIQGDLAKLARFARGSDGAAVTAHDAEANAQAQPRALANFLGCEKRVKYFWKAFRGNARPVVAKDQQGTVACAPAGNFDLRPGPVREFL